MGEIEQEENSGGQRKVGEGEGNGIKGRNEKRLRKKE